MIKTFAIRQFLRDLESIRFGRLELTTPEGRYYCFEGCEKKDISVHLYIYSWEFITKLILHGSVGFAEVYRDKLCETDNLIHLISLAQYNSHITSKYEHGNFLHKIISRLKPIFKPNNRKNSVENIRTHYDIGNDFYRLWLDKDMHYSSALYEKDGQTAGSLEQAQQNKCYNIIDHLKPSGNILEIGCGWGGFAELSLGKNDYAYKGITISEQQFGYAQNRMKKYPQSQIAFEDYRDQKGLYDHIVSIEMIEAVGEGYWQTYFDKIKSLLGPNGKVVIQAITIAEKFFAHYRVSNDLIRQFIFPGGLLPSFSSIHRNTEKANLNITHIESFGGDYAKTLITWLDNFEASLPEVYKLKLNEPFVRMWRLYLASCAALFATGSCEVSQIHIEHG